jgi:16S rRNA processing protein RimM
MTYSTGILLGRIVKTSGFSGTVAVKLEKHISEEMQVMESVFIETDGRPVPFLLSSIEDTGGGILKLTFRHYDSDVSVSRFIGCRVFAPDLSPGLGSAPALSPDLSPGIRGPRPRGFTDLKGVRVSSSDGSFLGTVTDSVDNKGQVLLELLSPAGRKILVPLHPDLVADADPVHKTLILNLPEGLDEIN